jgi:hypothetical protein
VLWPRCLVLDGVYRTNAEGEPEFIEIRAPSDEQVWEVLERIIKRVMKQLVRRGILVADQGETYLADKGDDSEEARTLRPLHRGSYALPDCLRSSGRPEGVDVARCYAQRNKWPAEVMRQPARLLPARGGARWGCQLRAGQRKALERLCRYVTRPALAKGPGADECFRAKSS